MKTRVGVLTLLLFGLLTPVHAETPTTSDRPQRPRVTVWGVQLTGPRVARRITPEWPPSERRSGRAHVILEVWLDERGKVADVYASVPGTAAVTKAAVNAVRRWIFEPAKVKGQPIPSVLEVGLDY